MEKRVAYIDNAKAICIILVVIGHLLIFCDLFENPIVDVLLKLIYSFHVPVFFILSGMLFSRHNLEISFWKYLKKKFLTLMVPYCFFEMLTCIIKMSIFGSSYINFRGETVRKLTV